MTIEAIFFDIDNTLYRPDFVPKSAIDALAKVQEKNIITAIATGRSLNRLPKPINHLRAVGLFPLIIASNGQHNTYRGNTITAHSFPIADLNTLTAAFNAQGWACLYYDDNYLISAGQHTCPDQSRFQQEAGFFISHDYHLYQPIYQICAFCPIEEDEKLQQILKDTPYQRARNNAQSADIYPKIGGKGRGIREACDVLNIDITKTAAFGDGSNDFCMFEAVGMAVAMGDGVEDLKKYATFVTTTLEEDGILQGLTMLGVLS